MAVGFVFAATFLLYRKALSIGMDGTVFAGGGGGDEKGAGSGRELGGFPVYVCVAVVAFTGVVVGDVPSHFIVVGGGLAGLVEWALSY